MKRKYNLKSDGLEKVKGEFVFYSIIKNSYFFKFQFFLKYIPLEISEIQM